MTRRSLLTSALLQPDAPSVLFCITDDQSWLHTGTAGCRWIQTPALDRLARAGAVFRNAFVATPSCAPSRAAVLTGQEFYRLGVASMNHTEWRRDLRGYPDLLAARGYAVGATGKGWGPGNWRTAGRPAPPAGPDLVQRKTNPPSNGISEIDYAANFAAFLDGLAPRQPFCFWAGFLEPHRVFEPGAGVKAGHRLDPIEVPAFLPDTPEVRSDLADYAHEIEWADRQLGLLLDHLERTGRLANTIVVFTADNGMAFPRAKGNLYEYGVHVPLVMAWPARIKGGQVLDDLVSLTDLAPTFLEAAGVAAPPAMTGRSLLPRLTGARRQPVRREVAFGIERHFPGSRPGGAGYPSRALRTDRFLLIQNLTPDRFPAGDRPGPVWPADDPTGGFGDTDGGPSKTVLCQNPAYAALFEKAFGKRPAVELYDCLADPANLVNLAADPAHRRTLADLTARLERHRRQTGDPRSLGRASEFDIVMQRFPALGAEVSRQQEGRKQ